MATLILWGWVTLSWLTGTALGLVRILVAISIFLGGLSSVPPFPVAKIAEIQASLPLFGLSFPGAEIIAWCAEAWLELIFLMIAWLAWRGYRYAWKAYVLSEHAAMTSTAITRYLNIEASTKQVEETAAVFFKGNVSAGTALGWIVRSIGRKLFFSSSIGSSFLPDDVLALRANKQAWANEDLKDAARSPGQYHPRNHDA